MLIRHQAINLTITILFILSLGLVFFCEVSCKVSAFLGSKIQQKGRLLHEKPHGWSFLLLLIVFQTLTAMNMF